jgi:anti-sigma factor ChrR (cupin superfamily)
MKLLRRRRAEPADCHEVARLLQSYLDHKIDAAAAARVAHHLEACRRCGLSAETYAEIKAALARCTLHVDPAALDRLTAFSDHLAAGDVR